MARNRIWIITGGTMVHVAPHFSVCAPAYGGTGDDLLGFIAMEEPEACRHGFVELVRTRMAGRWSPIDEPWWSDVFGKPHVETNDDLGRFLDLIAAREDTRAVFLPVAVCDWEPVELVDHERVNEEIVGIRTRTSFGKQEARLHTTSERVQLTLAPSAKLLGRLRAAQPDIRVAAFKTTTGASPEEQRSRALPMIESGVATCVLADDLATGIHFVLGSEGRALYSGEDRDEALERLVQHTLGA